MTKNKVLLLTLLMVLALIGIMVLQFVWMQKAFRVRNELFNRSVNEALIRSTERHETLSDVFLVHDIVAPPPPPVPLPGQIVRHKTVAVNGNMHPDNMQRKIIMNHDTVINSLNIDTNDKVRKQIRIISNNSHVGSDQQNITVEVEEVDSILQHIEDKIDHNITIMYSNSINAIGIDTIRDCYSPDWENKLGKRVERLKDVAGKMVLETWAWNQDFIPDTIMIKNILAEELLKRDIPIGYEFAVIRSDVPIVKSSGYQPGVKSNPVYTTPLFPNAIFNKNDFLSIYFPARNTFLIKTLILPSAFSIVFCIIIMGTFGMSIYYIMRQKKISEMKSDFINNMTHEFKTPLATISVATDSIVNPKVIGDKDQIINYASIIKKENLRMNQQVETILQIAQLDRKDFDFRFILTDIHELIDKSVQGLILQVESRGGFISVEKNAMNPMVTADPIHTLNMINNLLDNANKYSPDIPVIVVATKNTERGVWISVSDKGIGMNRQVQQRIFEKFYRETSGNIHNVKGFGLGLSYVKAVVDANGGEIKVNSEPGVGSTFEVFLPFSLKV